MSENKNQLSADGAKKIFQGLGIPPSFLDKAYSFAAPFAKYVPGFDNSSTQNMLDNVKKGMGGNRNARNKSDVFDRSKYKKV